MQAVQFNICTYNHIVKIYNFIYHNLQSNTHIKYSVYMKTQNCCLQCAGAVTIAWVVGNGRKRGGREMEVCTFAKYESVTIQLYVHVS